MLKQQRHRRIQQIVEAQGQATVAELARQFGVTEMTIRRDLGELSVRGLIERIHGGGLVPERRAGLAEPPVLERIREQAEAKSRIARAVAAMIEADEKVFLGSGTTTLAVAEALKHRSGLTVVTNALTVANALVPCPEITVIVIGGFLRRSELSLIGHFAETAMHDLRVGKVIMGIRGIHPEHGLTSDHLQELMTDRAIMRMSDKVIVVADHTKFGHIAASRTAPLAAATMVVTDTQAPAHIVAAIRAAGVEVIQV